MIRHRLSLIVMLFALRWLTASQTALADEIAAQSTNDIDRHVFSRLAEQQLQPSARSSDAEFLRRLCLNTTGQLPTPGEVRAFLADQDGQKRARVIETKLNDPLHAALWASRFSEWTGNSLDAIAADDSAKLLLSQAWHEWLRDCFARNEPYDRVVRKILTATSRGDHAADQWAIEQIAVTNAVRKGDRTVVSSRRSLDLFWQRKEIENEYPVRELAERVAATFLGLRINCARCHDHPFDRWSQQDYLAFVKVFDQVRHDLSPEMRREIAARLQVRRERVANGEAVGPPMPRITEVYVATSIDSAQQTDAADEHSHEIRAKALGGDFIAFEDQDRRVGFTDWLVDKDNPYFAKNLVNRVWAHYFGRGLVEPLDGLSSHLHEAAYPELLDELAQSFIDSGYNIKQLETLLLNSQAWQLSSVPNASNGDDQTYFSRAYVRLPLPEVVVDMWHAGTGIHYDLGDATLRGLHAVEVGPDRLPGDRWNEFYALFGRVKRSETCDCSAKGRPSIRQTLALMSDSRMLSDISGGRLNQLMQSEQADEAIIEELYLRTVSRYPTPDESAMLTEALASTQDRKSTWNAILWSLLNTQEFITIH